MTEASPPTLDAEIEAMKAGVRNDEFLPQHLSDLALGIIDRTVAIMDRRVRELREHLAVLIEQADQMAYQAHEADYQQFGTPQYIQEARIALGKPDGGRG